MNLIKFQMKNKIILCVIALFFMVGIYFVIIQPKLLLNKVSIDLDTTISHLGNPNTHYFTVEDCPRLKFISCKEMTNQSIKVIYVWSKGLDINIVAGFDESNQLKFKEIVHNELLSLY